MESLIPIFSNALGKEELGAVQRVFQSRWLGPGKEKEEFEKELGLFWGTNGVLATNSCTSALYIILKVLDIGPGDEIIIPTIHFVATLNAVLELGATPVFCDVQPDTLAADPESIQKKITPHTAGVVLLHYGGHIADIEGISNIAKGIYLIEDAANAPASTLNGKAAGTLGDAGCWSFDSMKILVTGDGGAMWFANQADTRYAQAMRFLGLSSRSGMDSVGKRDRWWEYKTIAPSGYFDMNDITAAMGREQLRKLPAFIARRKEIWEQYQDGLSGIGLKLPPEPPPSTTSSYYFYWLQTFGRDELANHLISNGIYCTFRYHPLHRVHGVYEDLPGAKLAASRTLNIPIHQNMSDADVKKVIGAIRQWAAV